MQFVLTVVRATDVAAKDANGTSDPYAIVHLIEDSPRAPLVRLSLSSSASAASASVLPY